MKQKSALRSFLLLAGSSLLAVSSASAATLYWDGNNTSANADGGTGTWINGTTSNWDTLAFGGADTVWTNGAHTAVFGGAAATVTIGTGGVTVGGLTFNANNYIIAAGTNGLNFSTGTNVIQSYIGNNGNTAASITGAVTGTGANLVLSSGADQRIFNLTFSGISSGGWTGTTTINAGTTLTTTSTSGNINQVLNSTSGITLNGGAIQFNRATNAGLNAISDTAAIAVHGGGTFGVTSADAGGASANETIGAVTLNSGQFNLNWTNNPSSGGNIILSGFTRSGDTSALTVSFGANGRFINSAVSTNTATNEIIGAWATVGAAAGIAAQNDYAIYTGGNGTFSALSRAASAQSTWTTTHAATSNYHLANAVGSAANGKLTESRYINTLRANTAEFGGTTAADSTTDVITYVGHSYANGDVLTLRNAGSNFNMVHGQPYYVINSDTVNGTFQVSTTPGGAAFDITGTGTAGQLRILAGVTLNGFTLGTNGILAANSGATVIGGGSGSSVTLPTTTSGNLYLTNGNASLWIDAPITNNDPLNNGSGVLTLVKGGTSGNGTGDVSLSGTNTYTGGTVINSGALTFRTANSWVSGQNITFGGAGRINASVGALSGGILNVNQGAVGYITGTSAITFTSTTGAGKLVYAGGNSATLAMGNASGFTGDLQVSNAVGSNPYTSITFSSIGDAAGSSIQYGGGQGDSNQRGIIAYDGSSALTLENRQIQLLPRSLGNHVPRRNVLMNNSTNDDHKLVIKQNLLNTTDRSAGAVDTEFQLDGTNMGNNEFAGNIGNSTYSNVANPTELALSVIKNGAGKWILSGDNTFTGRLLISQGTLSVGTFNGSNTAGALGMGSVIQLGGAEPSTPLTGGSGLAAAVLLSGSNSGTLEYTGGAASTTRSFQIGTTGTGNTGGGTIANNGSGALTFTAANFNDANAGVSVARTLTLAGSNSDNNEIQGTIRDNVASTGRINLAKSGTGTWALTGTNTYTGTTVVNEGTLRVGKMQSLYNNTPASWTNANINVKSGATLALNVDSDGTNGFDSGNLNTLLGNISTGVTTAALGLQGGARIGIDTSTATGGTFTQGNAITNSTGSGGFNGAIGLTKLGTGTLVLDKTNSYTGATTVTTGTLIVNGNISTSSLTTVNSGATLGGIGTVGSLTIDSGGFFSPGNSPGITTVDGDYIQNGTLQLEIEGLTAGNGTGFHDQVVVNGTVTLAGLLSITTFSGAYAKDDLIFILLNDSDDAISGTFTGLAQGAVVGNYLGFDWQISYTGDSAGNTFTGGNDVVLMAIPEPRAALLGGIGLLMLLRRRRA